MGREVEVAMSARARRPGRRQLGLGAGLVGYLALQYLGRGYGSTLPERHSGLPGDDLIRHPQTHATHAATLGVPPERVWPWLAQVGWRRGGWYTPRWVDVLFFPDNRPSADHLLPEHQHLEVGDFVPDGPPESQCGFVVSSVWPDHELVLHSTTHLPLWLRERGLAGIDWTWSFVLYPVDEGRGTRLVFRWRARTTPWWLTLGAQLAIVPADFVMSRGMLRGLRRRAELAGRQGSGQVVPRGSL